MTETKWVVLVVVVVLLSAAFVGCGGAAPSAEGPAPSDTAPETPSGSGTPSSTGGLAWNDVPVYPGAGQVARGSWVEPQQDAGELSRVEWRHYQTGDSKSKVFAYYQSAMPGKGWQMMMEMDMGELSWLVYTKNDEKDVAWVYVAEDDGKTLLHLMRGSE